MAKYLRPRRGAKEIAIEQDFVLRPGELFLEFPNGSIGNEAGRIVIGNGISNYSIINYSAAGSTNSFQPFITDPSIYIPRFEDISPTADYNATTTVINQMGDGSSSSNILPEVIKNIKKSLYKLLDDVISVKNITDTKANIEHNHDNIYIKKTDPVLNASTADYAKSVTWNNVTDKPSTFAPVIGDASTQAAAGNHNHNDLYYNKSTINSCTSSLNTAINSKANSSALSSYTPLSTFNSTVSTLNNKFGKFEIVQIDLNGGVGGNFSTEETGVINTSYDIPNYNNNLSYIVIPRKIGFAAIQSMEIDKNNGKVTISFYLPFTGHQKAYDIRFYVIGYKAI